MNVRLTQSSFKVQSSLLIFEDLLSLRKATFTAGREIETIYQVNYKGANIVDETESSYDGFYVYRGGDLVEVD